VVLEAMASGLPVVATRVGGVPEVVRDGQTGYMADPQDEASLVELVHRLVENDHSRTAMGGRARAYVEECHSSRRLADILDQFYGAVLA